MSKPVEARERLEWRKAEIKVRVWEKNGHFLIEDWFKEKLNDCESVSEMHGPNFFASLDSRLFNKELVAERDRHFAQAKLESGVGESWIDSKQDVSLLRSRITDNGIPLVLGLRQERMLVLQFPIHFLKKFPDNGLDVIVGWVEAVLGHDVGEVNLNSWRIDRCAAVDVLSLLFYSNSPRLGRKVVRVGFSLLPDLLLQDILLNNHLSGSQLDKESLSEEVFFLSSFLRKMTSEW